MTGGIVRRPRWRAVATSALVAALATGAALWVVGRLAEGGQNGRTGGRAVLLVGFCGLVAIAFAGRAIASLWQASCGTCGRPIDASSHALVAPVSSCSSLVAAAHRRDVGTMRDLTRSVQRADGDVAVLVVQHCPDDHVGRVRVMRRRGDARAKPARGARWVEVPGGAASALR